MRQIDADAMRKEWLENGENEYVYDTNAVLDSIDNQPTIELPRWIPASEPPKEYRDEYGELIPFLVCENGTEYPFRAMYDGKLWGDGIYVVPVKWWMPLPEPPKEENHE